MVSLLDLFKAHDGKASDKWSSNIEFYNNVFRELREQPIRLLEIGVQNGGSLEIWAKYFPNAICLVGCDINEKCRELVFEDPRISVIVGDANEPDVYAQIHSISDKFDIIIDDGSHRSGDVIRTFSAYFPILSEGGMFIAEDLHCSYWGNYDGGVEHPGSSMNFFRRLTDYINIEHWGGGVPPEEMLSYFAERWGTRFDPESLKRIAQVQFRNSIAVVSKEVPERVGLGPRVIAGSQASVNEAVLRLNGMSCGSPPQETNAYGPYAARRERTPELFANRERELSELTAAHIDLEQAHKDLVQDAESAQTELVRARDLLSAQERQLSELTAAHNGLEQAHKDLVQDAESAQTELVRARDLLSTLERELSELTAAHNGLGLAHKDLVQHVESVQTELVGTRYRPLKAWADLLVFRVLSRLAKASPPFSKRRTERFARSAAKRDPLRRVKYVDHNGPVLKYGYREGLIPNYTDIASAVSVVAPTNSSHVPLDPPASADAATYLATKQQVLGSGFWDERWYLTHHFREYVVWRAGQKTNNSAVDHYLQVGWKAGYSPSRIFVYGGTSNGAGINPISDLLTRVWPHFHFSENTWLPERHVIQSYRDERDKRVSRKVVYCCIIGEYDSIIQPYHIDHEWDYICFTDDARLIERGEDGVWQFREALYPEMSPDRRNRYHKMHPHHLFPDYDESVYVDGNVNIISSYLFDEIRLRKRPILLPQHFCRTCIYEEIEALLRSTRTSEENRKLLPEQIDFLRKMGFPEGYGLTENNVIYRRHHDNTVKRIMARWWDLLCCFSSRDQTALSYVLWRERIDPQDISFPNTRCLNTDFWVFEHKGEESKSRLISVDDRIRPAFEADCVPVVLSCNEGFVSYLGVVLTSLIENASDDRNYDIIVLESDVSETSKERIKTLCKRNVSIRFFNMRAILAQLKDFDVYVEGYVPPETYNKIFLKEIMEGYKKVLYIDTDIVIRSDIAELYDTDLFGKALGASPNVANIHAARQNTEIRGNKFGDYLRDVLGVEQFDHYFQAGIIVLDMTSEKAKNLLKLSLEKLKEIKQPVFFDQCIFNSIFYGDVHFFSTTWNHVWYLQNYSYLKYTLDDNLFFDYAKSRLDPKIIHYASGDKPTNKFDWRLSSHFWAYLRRSPFADSLIAEMEEKNATHNLPVPSLERLCSEPAPRVLVHLHAFYCDQLDYIFDKLENIEFAQWDLVVTASENADAIEEVAKSRFGAAEIVRVKNQGFDIYPFLKVLQAKNLSHYDYVLKLHTKNARPDSEDSKVYGLPVPGYKWRDDLVDALLSSKSVFTKNLTRLVENPALGCVAAGQYIFSINENRERTTYKLRHWMNQLRIETGEHYVGGTMFLARAYPFERLKALNPDELDFSSGDVTSGSHKNLAHVFERLLGLVVETEGLTLSPAPMPDN